MDFGADTTYEKTFTTKLKINECVETITWPAFTSAIAKYPEGVDLKQMEQGISIEQDILL